MKNDCIVKLQNNWNKTILPRVDVSERVSSLEHSSCGRGAECKMHGYGCGMRWVWYRSATFTAILETGHLKLSRSS